HDDHGSLRRGSENRCLCLSAGAGFRERVFCVCCTELRRGEKGPDSKRNPVCGESFGWIWPADLFAGCDFCSPADDIIYRCQGSGRGGAGGALSAYRGQLLLPDRDFVSSLWPVPGSGKAGYVGGADGGVSWSAGGAGLWTGRHPFRGRDGNLVLRAHWLVPGGRFGNRILSVLEKETTLDGREKNFLKKSARIFCLITVKLLQAGFEDGAADAVNHCLKSSSGTIPPTEMQTHGFQDQGIVFLCREKGGIQTC